ncbi:MAG TPA: substrate-binding domain-containing protein [Chitinophaga sp.]|nr:substrate-binding domain-containing protein [Chitinophaga sp.]
MKKKISIHDIAKEMKVSSATVSYVLNGKAAEKRISKEMEKKILDYARKLSYRPNRIAKSLRTGKSRIIGMLVEGISDPFFASIARIVEKLAGEQDYRIFYASTENDAGIARNLIRAFRDAQVDGYIIAPPPGIEEDIKELMEDGFPVILFDRYFPGLPTCNVVVNNYDGAWQAIQHFLEQGYKEIGFVTLSSAQTQMRDRLNGYTSAMQERDLTPCVLKVPFEEKTTPGKMTDNIRRFLIDNPKLEAVLFATNYLATAGLEAINSLQLKIPGNLAVIGFDDNTHFSLFTPAITALAQPVTEISEQVIRLLMACMATAPEPPPRSTVVLPTTLIIRESSIQHVKNNVL